MSQIFVKAHARGKSMVKAFRRKRASGQPAKFEGTKIKGKYAIGFRLLKRQGWNPEGFLFKLSKRAQGKKTSKYYQ